MNHLYDLPMLSEQTSMAYSFVNRLILFSLFSALIFTGCNQSSDQREFEREAFSAADNFTETEANGNVVRDDPDDWRISPFFQGLVEVEPVYPNPVQTTDLLSLDVIITGVESVSGLVVFVYYGNNNINLIYQDFQRPIPPGISSIPLNPLEIAQISENPQGLYRIIILDANENVISYGDVQVE